MLPASDVCRALRLGGVQQGRPTGPGRSAALLHGLYRLERIRQRPRNRPPFTDEHVRHELVAASVGRHAYVVFERRASLAREPLSILLHRARDCIGVLCGHQETRVRPEWLTAIPRAFPASWSTPLSLGGLRPEGHSRSYAVLLRPRFLSAITGRSVSSCVGRRGRGWENGGGRRRRTKRCSRRRRLGTCCSC